MCALHRCTSSVGAVVYNNMTAILIIAATAAFAILTPVLLTRYLPNGQQGRQLKAVLQIIAPVVAALPVFVGLLEYVSDQKARTDSAARMDYIRATQLLMEEKAAKQLAGITAVAQLAATDSERTWLMTESLSGLVRLNAQRENDSADLERGSHPRAAVPEPPCPPSAPVEYRYNYSTCGQPKPLFQKSPAVQVAVTALGSRDRNLEDVSDPPPRFKALVRSTSKEWLGNVPDWLTNIWSESPRQIVVRYIKEYWSRHERKESSDQLIGEVQVGRTSVQAETGHRPWLNLSHSDLRGIDAKSAWLDGGNFTQSDMSFGTFENASMAHATLADAWLVGAHLFGIDLHGADLQFSDVRGSDLGHADLRNAWMSGADFSRANFWQARLNGGYLIAAEMKDLETAAGANLDEIVAYRANFTDANISGDGSFGVCMRKAFLRNTTFDRAWLLGVDLRGSDLQDATFRGAHLQGADLRGAQLDGANLDMANLSETDIRGVDLSKTIGEPTNLNNAIVDKTTRWHTKLSESASHWSGLSRDCSAKRSLIDREQIKAWKCSATGGGDIHCAD